MLCESRRDDSYLQLLFLTVLFSSEKPSEETVSVLRVLPSVGVNLRCCFSCLNDSLETHLLDVSARRETETSSRETFKDMKYEKLALWRLLDDGSDV